MNQVIATANIFFDNVELDLAWSQLLGVVDQSFRHECGDLAREIPGLLSFVLEKISICDDEAKAVHLPMLLVIISKNTVSDGDPDYLQIIWVLFNQILFLVLEQGENQVAALQADRTPGLSMKELTRIAEDFESSGKVSLDTLPTNFWLQASIKAVSSANTYFMDILPSHSGILFTSLRSNELIFNAVFRLQDLYLSELEGGQFFGGARLWVDFLMKWCLSESSASYWPEILKFIGIAADHSVQFVESSSFVDSFLALIWRSFTENTIAIDRASSLILQLNGLDPVKTENFISSVVCRGELLQRVKSVELFAYTWTLSGINHPYFIVFIR